MFNINKIREETDITGAGDWKDDKYEEAPTKALIFELKFLTDTTAWAIADFLTQFGSVLEVKDMVEGLIVDYEQIADLFYYEWYRRRTMPQTRGHSNDTDVGHGTLEIWFGDPLNPHQGLNAQGLTTKLTSPASGNQIKTEKLSIFQLTCAKAHFTEYIKHERVAFSTEASGWKQVPINVDPKTKKILLALIYQHTPRDDSTTDTITVDQIEVWKDGNAGIKKFYADFLQNLFSPNLGQPAGIFDADETYLGNYIPFDFQRLNNGLPYVPAREGVKKTLKLNIYGGDAQTDNRINQYSLISVK